MSKIEPTLLAMYKIVSTIPNDDLYYGFDHFGEDLSRDRMSVNCKELRKLGYVHFARGLMNDEGEVGGAGYRVTEEGIDWMESLQMCETCEYPRLIHICYSCSPNAKNTPHHQVPGNGCLNCRNTGWSQSPCLPR